MYVVPISGNAQVQKSIFEYNPKLVFGYAVLDTTALPSFNQWKIEINERNYSDSINYVDKCVFSKTLIKQNYVKLPDEYFIPDNGYFILDASAIDVKGNIIVHEELELTQTQNLGGYTYDYSNTWPCNGFNYAYNITANLKKINNVVYQTGYLSLDPNYMTYDTWEGGTPYYAYVSPEDWDALTNNCAKWTALYNFHELSTQDESAHDFPIVPIFDGIQLIKLEGVGSAHLVNYYGQTITGNTAYGIQKTKGSWNGHPLETSEWNNIMVDQDLTYAIQQMNDRSDDFEYYGFPDLECYGQYSATSFSHPSANNAASRSKFLKCMQKIDWTQNYYTAFQRFKECMFSLPATPSAVLTFESNGIKTVTINNTGQTGSNNNFSPIEINLTEIFDENGKITVPDFKLEPGLYTFGYVFDDYSYTYYVTEITKTVSSGIDYADFVAATIRPVPIKEDYFYVDLYSSIKANAIFELYDFNGKLLYSEKITIPENSSSLVVKPKYGIPTGTLVNIIRFEDNSTITINSTKQKQ